MEHIVKRVKSDGSKIKVGNAFTLSRNYNSCMVNVGVELPTTILKLKSGKAAEEAWAIVEKELRVKFKEAQKFLEKLA